jgi:hypothetical protein
MTVAARAPEPPQHPSNPYASPNSPHFPPPQNPPPPSPPRPRRSRRRAHRFRRTTVHGRQRRPPRHPPRHHRHQLVLQICLHPVRPHRERLRRTAHPRHPNVESPEREPSPRASSDLMPDLRRREIHTASRGPHRRNRPSRGSHPAPPRLHRHPGSRSLSEYSPWPRPRRIGLQSRRSRRGWVQPNKEATTTSEGQSVRSRRVGSARGVCGVARLASAPLQKPTRLTRNTQTGSSRNLFKAANPVEWVRMVIALGPMYALVLVIIASYTLLIALLERWAPWLPLQFALILFALLSLFSTLGGALYERRHELGLETSVSLERTQALQQAQELHQSERLVTEAYGKQRAGSHTEAWQLLQHWLTNRGHDPDDYRCD